MRKFFIICSLLIGVLGLPAGKLAVSTVHLAAAANTAWYVDNSVASSGNGQSWGTAWDSFAAIDWGSIQPGDTIYISGGTTSQTYNEQLSIGASGTAGSLITITKGTDAGHNGRVIIDGNNGSLGQGIYIIGVSHVYIKGIDIRQTYMGVNLNCDGGVVDDVILDSLNIYEYYDQAGIAINGHCGSNPPITTLRNLVIRNSRITSTFPYHNGQTDNIYVQWASNVTIENNTLSQDNQHERGSMDNIQFYTVGNAIVRNNFMVNHGTHGDQNMILGVTGTENTVRIYNNVALHLGGGSVLIIRSYDETTPTVYVYENTLVAAPQEPLYITTVSLEKPAILNNNILAHIGVAGARGATLINFPGLPVTNILNNLFYVENGGVVEPPGFGGTWIGTSGQVVSGFYWDTWTSIGGNGYNSDSNFVDFSNNNFKVQLPSNAVDNGLPLGAPYNVDKDGVSRPQGSAWDIGAYELVSAGNPPNNPPTFGQISLSPNAVITVKNIQLYNQLKGRIILQVESHGEAYYIHPQTKKMYYLGRPADAFAVMREQGVGITNVDLAKIPVGLSHLSGNDTDGDGLPDAFEEAVGTDINKTDTDGDGQSDKTELASGDSPLSSGKLNFNVAFAKLQAGKIFIQVESYGEAWYINPVDGKRYYMSRPEHAFALMRSLGLGISNQDYQRMK